MLRLSAILLASGAGALYLSANARRPLLAVLYPFGWTTSFLVAAGVCYAGAVLWLFIDPNHKMSLEA